MRNRLADEDISEDSSERPQYVHDCEYDKNFGELEADTKDSVVECED